jgi:uncharacterized membrane protein YqaE (UPF0057 family)
MFKRFIVKHNKSLLITFDENYTVNQLCELIKEKFNLSNNDFFLTHNSKLLSKKRFIRYYNIQDYDVINITFRKRGGFIGMILAFIAVVAVLAILAKPLIDMLRIFGHMLVLLFHFLGIFPPLLETVGLLFDPKRFIDDIIFGITFGIKMLFSGIFSSINVGSSSRPKNNSDSSMPKTCVSPTLANLIFLVICPPLALFLDRGIQGLFHVIVCSLLTVKMYYFPGFIYAAMHILC